MLAYLIEPELFKTRTTGISVSAGENYGQTVETTARRNVTMVENPDRDRVYQLIVRSAQHVFQK